MSDCLFFIWTGWMPMLQSTDFLIVISKYMSIIHDYTYYKFLKWLWAHYSFLFVDNMFSSLVGIQISWRFHYSESSMGVATHCLVHVPLKDTALSDEIDTRIELEEKVTVIAVIVTHFLLNYESSIKSYRI